MILTPYTLTSLHTKPWFQALAQPQQELIAQSFYLYDDVKLHGKVFFDYSFIVMPASKGYEGYVKDMLFGLGLISAKRYYGKRFRVGKALNPDIARDHPDRFEVLYDDLAEVCRTAALPDMLWTTWKECRNLVFHYYIKIDQKISLEVAFDKVQAICKTIDYSATICQPLIRKDSS